LPDRAFIYNWRTNNPTLDRTETDKISCHLADRPLKAGVTGWWGLSCVEAMIPVFI
jgi:hypothetical protein